MWLITEVTLVLLISLLKVLTIFFNYNILSKIVHNPLLIIDSFDYIAKFLSINPNVSLVSDNAIFSWIWMKSWKNGQVQKLFMRMQNVPVFEFNLEQLYLQLHWETKSLSKRLNFTDSDITQQSISMEYFSPVFIFIEHVYIILIIIFIIQYMFSKIILSN